jgi:uncharacterized protein with beta-barrel porin domain
MKLLKASFLLAAAASATQLGAATYNVSWSNAALTATAVGTLDIDTSLLVNGGNNASGGPWLTGMSITITGAAPGMMGGTNGTYTLSANNYAALNFSAPVNLNTELVGQAGLSGGGGMFASVLNVTLDSYNWHTHGNNTLANDSSSGDLILRSFILAGPSGVADIPVWLSSINGQNRIYTTGSTLAGLPLEGAHHRPMLSFDRMGKESQAWATGDFGSSSRTRDVHVTSGEAGINWNVGKSFLFGVAGGHAVQNQDLAFGGSSATKGDFFIAELDYRPEGTQWIVSLLGMVGSWESKTNRGYTSGGSTDFSNGVADTITRSARLRVDAPSLATFGGFGFAPFASYTVTQTVVGGYTETGGAFPASFNEQEHNATEARLGVTASKDLSEKTKLLLSVEGIHRFDGVGPSLTGQDVTGGVSFSLPGVAPRADCVRFGFDIDHKLSADTLLNISAHASTVGEAHDVSAAISIRRAF